MQRCGCRAKHCLAGDDAPALIGSFVCKSKTDTGDSQHQIPARDAVQHCSQADREASLGSCRSSGNNISGTQGRGIAAAAGMPGWRQQDAMWPF